MQSARWWHVAVAGAAVAILAILLIDDSAPWQLALGGVAVAVFIAAWFGFGWRCADGSRGSAVFVVITILFAGSVTVANPAAAIVQCIAFPLVWTRLERLGPTLVANFALAISVGTGLYVSTGSSFQAIVTEALSLSFSIGLGLWITSIATQSEKRRELLDELRAAQDQLALLSRDAGVTSERERLAREIHDTIAQDLTGLVMLAQRASRELAAGTLEPSHIEVLEENARAALAETRALVAATASPGLEGGISAALERLAIRFERETGITVTVTSTGSVTDRDTEVVLLRCAQEALANIRKHADATATTITLADTSLEVTDNGHGFDVGAESAGYGLNGMRDRLALVGGSITVASTTDGTTLRVLA